MSRLRLCRGRGGEWYHVLDEQPVHFREPLELALGELWVPGEYVWAYQPYSPVFLSVWIGHGTVVMPREEILVPLTASAEVRRPATAASRVS